MVADLDELCADGREPGERPVSGDRVLERERLDRRGLKERLVVLDRPESLEPEDRSDGLLLSPMQTAQSPRLGRLICCLRRVPKAERLVAKRRRPTVKASYGSCGIIRPSKNSS
jgi:hypothetical protein